MPGLGPIERFDRYVDDRFDALRGRPAFDRAFYVASELGDWSLVWHLLGVAQGVTSPDGCERALRLSAALGVEAALVNGPVKALFRRTRPVAEFERPHRLRQPLTSSFPSGHASAGFLAAGLLSDHHRAKPAFYAAAMVVAASRVHVRIHHASDVIAGAALGAGLAVLVRKTWPLGRRRGRRAFS